MFFLVRLGGASVLFRAGGSAAGPAGGQLGLRTGRVFNALGAVLWVGTWVSLGYLAGNHINTIYHYITQYSYYALIAALVLLAAYVTRRVMRRRSRPARKAASEPGGNAAHQKVPVTRKDAATHKPLAVQESSAVDGAQEALWSGRGGCPGRRARRGSHRAAGHDPPRP